MSEPIVITRDKVKRGWSDLEPKIAIAGVVGFLSIVALIVAKQFDVELPPEVASAATIALSLLAGYATPSAGTVVTRRTQDAITVESHTSPTVTTVTAPTRIVQPSSAQMYEDHQNVLREQIAKEAADEDDPSFTQVLDPQNAETEVMPPSYQRARNAYDEWGTGR